MRCEVLKAIRNICCKVQEPDNEFMRDLVWIGYVVVQLVKSFGPEQE